MFRPHRLQELLRTANIGTQDSQHGPRERPKSTKTCPKSDLGSPAGGPQKQLKVLSDDCGSGDDGEMDLITVLPMTMTKMTRTRMMSDDEDDDSDDAMR